MKLCIILCLVALGFIMPGQVIDFYYQKLDCDTARTSLEKECCSRFLVEQATIRYDTLFAKICGCLDTLIAEDHRTRRKMLKQDPNCTFDSWTDYPKVKKLFVQSGRDFTHYADNEMYLEGEFYGPARSRWIAENMRLIEIYNRRIAELTLIFKEHCN